MPNTKNRTIRIHAAAAHFAIVSKHADEIAEAFGVHTRTVTKWAKTDAWKEGLTAVGYTGETSFQKKPTRDAERDNTELFVKTRTAYLDAVEYGLPPHKWASAAAEAVGLPRIYVHHWAKRHGWRRSAFELWDAKKG